MTATLSTVTTSGFELDRSSATPLHRQLFGYLIQLIETGQLPPGSRLPPEIELSEVYGVSRGTVRQAMRGLSDAGLIHRKTKNGTVVRMQAQSVKATERIIGVIFPETHDAFCLNIMKGVQAACRGRAYHVAFGYSHHSSELERDEVKRMRDARFGGVLVLPHDNAEFFEKLLRSNYPFVCIDQTFENAPCDFVGVDNVDASFGATEHLIGLGHRRIFFAHQNIDLTHAPSTVRDRYRGYRNALAASGLQFEPSWVIASTPSYVDFLKQLDRPGAVVAVNDNTALELIDIALRSGLQVPGDLAIVGFDDVPLAASLDLTTVRQPSVEIGLRAAQILIDHIEKKQSLTQQVILPTQLVVRKSCGSTRS